MMPEKWEGVYQDLKGLLADMLKHPMYQGGKGVTIKLGSGVSIYELATVTGGKNLYENLRKAFIESIPGIEKIAHDHALTDFDIRIFLVGET